MAIAILIETPGLTQEQYEAAAQQIDQAGPFERWLTHIAGPTEGGWRIVDVWTSQAAADAAYGSDAFRQATAPLPESTFSPWPAHALDTGSGRRKLS